MMAESVAGSAEAVWLTCVRQSGQCPSCSQSGQLLHRPLLPHPRRSLTPGGPSSAVGAATARRVVAAACVVAERCRVATARLRSSRRPALGQPHVEPRLELCACGPTTRSPAAAPLHGAPVLLLEKPTSLEGQCFDLDLTNSARDSDATPLTDRDASCAAHDGEASGSRHQRREARGSHIYTQRYPEHNLRGPAASDASGRGSARTGAAW
eukprot:COSAG06_NODE_3623_length_5105_cov_2.312225_3_plen_210_part_00